MSVNSTLGLGSTFQFTIKAKKCSSNSSTIQSENSLGAKSSSSVLVVEDNPVNLELCLRCLKKIGFAADSCASGEQALIMQKENHYDIILMDVQLPGQSVFLKFC